MKEPRSSMKVYRITYRLKDWGRKDIRFYGGSYFGCQGRGCPTKQEIHEVLWANCGSAGIFRHSNGSAMKHHFANSSEPLKEGSTIAAICGAEVPKAVFVALLDCAAVGYSFAVQAIRGMCRAMTEIWGNDLSM